MSGTQRRPMQFGTQLAQHVSGPLSYEFDENLYLEQSPEGSKFPYILLGTPGLSLLATVGDGPIRGLHQMGSYVYAVSGNTAYRIASSGAADELGYVEGTGLVQMADNGTYVWIATGGILYATNGSELIQVTNGDGITDVAYQDGYLMGVVRGTQDLWISAVDDITISGLDFTTVDTLPDLCVGIISDHREPLVFKEGSIEAFYNSGAADFPFQRSQVVERGCVSAASIAKHSHAVYWLGDDLQVYRMSGYQAQPISTPSVARLVKDESSPQTALGYIYQDEGHAFYVLTLSGVTVCFDITTGRWHKRKSVDIGRWRANGHVWQPRWKKNLVGDYANGSVYELSATTYDENGSRLVRVATGAPVFNSGYRFIVDEFMLDIEPGVALGTGFGSNPQVGLDWTADGGKTWSNQLHRAFGRIADRDVRPTWHGLGGHYNWTPRITIDAPVPVRIAGAYYRAEMLAA